MSATYNFNIGSLKRKLQQSIFNNVVIEAAFSVHAYSIEHPQFTYSCNGSVEFSVEDLNEDSFIPFDEITQDQVISWILASEEVTSLDDFSYVKYAVDYVNSKISELAVEDTVYVNWEYTPTESQNIVEQSIDMESR
jgi:hypothetical protein